MAVESSLRTLARAVVPRSFRVLVRRPSATLRWLWSEAAAHAGVTARCPMLDDWTVRCHPVSAAAFRLEVADPEQRGELAAFAARCTPGMVLFDIGASYGAFSLATLRYGGPTARSIAVDPSAVSNRILRRNLALAGAGDRVQVLEAAVGAEDGTLTMLTTGPAGEHYLVGTDAARPDVVRVPQYTLPTLADRVGLVPTHLKIDVEGFEGEVLQGGRDWLREHRPLLFLELHIELLRDRGRRPEDVLALAAECGYERFERLGTPVDPAALPDLPVIRVIGLPGSWEPERSGGVGAERWG